MKIKSVLGREILDSRGEPTVEVELILSSGAKFLAAVPSGKSTGKFEALELRDGDSTRYGGKGVQKAVDNINNKISSIINGKDPSRQSDIDKAMIDLDGTKNKENLGANAILAVSLAVCKAGAYSNDLPLYKYISELSSNQKNIKMPIAMFNVINGGQHADNNLDVQEFMIVPTEAGSFKKRLEQASEHFHRLRVFLQNRGYSTAFGDEGGYAPNLTSDVEAIEAIRDSGNSKLAFDFAGSQPRDINYSKLINDSDVISLEDPEGEDDWEGWKIITDDLGERTMIVGDDLFVTNTERLKKGIEMGVANAILIKPNQIGTVSETLDVIKLAQKNNYKIVVSHRSGETEDTFIADLAVGVGANFIKTGAPNRGERISKYNRLLRIEEELYV